MHPTSAADSAGRGGPRQQHADTVYVRSTSSANGISLKINSRPLFSVTLLLPEILKGGESDTYRRTVSAVRHDVRVDLKVCFQLRVAARAIWACEP